MVTVLMCLFIVLFAVSNVDKTKFELLANSLATGFGQESTEGGADTAEGVIVPPELQDDDGVVDLAARAETEFESLVGLRDRMSTSLAAQGLQDTVQFVIDDRGLQVGLVGAETFFADNSTDLSAKADAVLDTIGDVLATVDNQVSVEGTPITGSRPLPSRPTGSSREGARPRWLDSSSSTKAWEVHA